MAEKKRMIVGISGASCTILAVLLLKAMQEIEDWETHLVVSKSANRTLEHETSYTIDTLQELAFQSYPVEDIGANIASGTFHNEGMVVVPCSMKTLSGIAHGYAENLLIRAADVTLKERRKLLLMVRETPLNLIHLRNMTDLAGIGAVIMPLMMTCYNHPKSIEDMMHHLVGKIMAEFGIEYAGFKRWGACS